MKNLKRMAAILAVMAVAMTAFTACGGDTEPEVVEPVTEVEVEETEAETEPETEEEVVETEAPADFTLLDVDASMIKTGLYATGENGEEIVFAMFNYNGVDYTSLMMFEADGSNDVICGAYTGATETDENGIAWSMLTFDDVYTGATCKIGCAEPDDGTCYIFDQQANIYEAKYLTADETVDYMAACVVVSAEEGGEEGDDEAPEEETAAEEGSDGFSLLDVDASMVKIGLYATGENGEEIVFTMFTYDGTDYTSLMMFEADGSNDVICGPYTAATETDDNGIAWSMLTFDDVYTGSTCKIGCAEPGDGTCYIFDQQANIYEAKYLTADETTTYMAACVVVSASED